MYETNGAGTDIIAYLKQHQEKELLRFITCGSVDDGKSTLIGRLLHDSKLIYEDQLAAVKADSRKCGTTGDEPDLALLVDGLQSEREQGITIDVAYRYFSTSRRKFIIADTPGHEQYTRNMATGASTANLAIILIDARNGVLTQTRRHSYIVDLLGIRHVIVAVNKMDAVGYDRDVFDRIREDYLDFAQRLGVRDILFVPISALKGDNVVHWSDRMPWYQGRPLMEILETIEIADDANLRDFRFPVQYVNRPNADFRGYCGTVASGVVKPGDRVMVLPSRRTSTVQRVVTADGDLDEAQPPMAVTITLADEIDISRGDMIVHAGSPVEMSEHLDVMIVWMASEPLLTGRTYDIKMAGGMRRGTVEKIHYVVDVNTQEHRDADVLNLNEIASCRLNLTQPVIADTYRTLPVTGSLIFIDRLTNATAGAGMITGKASPRTHVVWHEYKIAKQDRMRLAGQKPCVLWLTGLSGSGKSTIAGALEAKLFDKGYRTYLLDGDNIRHGLNKDLGFSDADRVENIRRIGEVSRLFVDAGVIVLTAFISPFQRERDMVRALVEKDEFIEIFVDAPLDVCEQRDPKGLYKKARRGEIKNFTGIDSEYQRPASPEIVLQTGDQNVEECVEAILRYLSGNGYLA